MDEFVLPEGSSPRQRAQVAALAEAAARNPAAAPAALALANALYEAGARRQAVEWWEKTARMDREDPTVWRNLGIGYFNVFHDAEAAKGAYLKALRLGLQGGAPAAAGAESNIAAAPIPPGDARVLYERDQLWKRLRERPNDRLTELEKYPQLVRQRDDLTVEYCALLNQGEHYAQALDILRQRRFVPPERGRRLSLAQWARANIGIGRQAFWRSAGSGGDPRKALAHFQSVLAPPENLGETWPPTSNLSEAHYWAGLAARAAGAPDAAQRHLTAAADACGAAAKEAAPAYSDQSYWTGLALHELGRHHEAHQLYEAMLAFSQSLMNAPPPPRRPNTSLAATPPFDEDPQARQTEQALLLEVLARHGLNGENGADRKTARRLLTDVLRDNPSQQLAADLIVALDWMP